ncbi:MAG: APC family permease [Tissierellaceae bacterium]|nr:APC family permease [Tissierellaceae bacterium]
MLGKESVTNQKEIIDGLNKGPEGILTRQELVWLAVGQVIGAGVIALIGPSMAITGSSIWLAYLTAIVFGIFLVFPFMVISGTVRLSGGAYSAVYSIVGKRAGGIYLIGTIPSLISLASYPIASAAYIESLIPNVNVTIIALTILTIFYVINLAGAKFMAKIQTILGYSLIMGLISFVIFGLPKVNWTQISFSSPNFMLNGMDGFFTAVFILIFSTHGYYFSIGYSNVAKNARKDLPFSMMVAIPVILILYVGCGIVAAGVLPFEEVAGKPLTYVAKEALPTAIFWIFYLGGAMGALLTSLNSSFGYFSNIIAAGAENGWLPSFFKKQNKNASYWVVLTLGYFIGLLPIIFKFSVTAITSNAMFVSGVLMILGFVAAWMLPEKYPLLWERSTMRMPVKVFKFIMILCFIMEVVVIIYSARSSNVVAVVISTIYLIFCILYSNVRLKSGEVKSDVSLWYD